MNATKFLENERAAQSHALMQALELCSWENRADLGLILYSGGVMDSRWPETEEWTRMAGTIAFRLRPAGKHRKFGEKPYFHRLEVLCPCCGRWTPRGRLHQHARTHVNARLASSEPLMDGPRASVWYKRWWVDQHGIFRRMPNEAQRGFPQQPAGF